MSFFSFLFDRAKVKKFAGTAGSKCSVLAMCLNLELGGRSVFCRVGLKSWIDCQVMQFCRPKKYSLIALGMSVSYVKVDVKTGFQKLKFF